MLGTTTPPRPWPPPQPSRRRHWLGVAEVGGVWGLRFLLGVCRILGRAPARAVLRLIVFYYMLFARGARRASRTYLRRVGEPAGWRAVYGHLLRFAQVTLDRVFMLLGQHDRFTIDPHGHDHIVAAVEAPRGAILLGAHLGSTESLRMQGRIHDVAIHVVGDFRNARRINAVLDDLSPDHGARVVEIDPEDRVAFMLHLEEVVERGDFVAILGDRAAPGMKTATVDFLGHPAEVPVGPYALAALLRCPIYLVFGLHRPPRGYELHCEPFAETVVLPRGDREGALRAYAQRYAERLEHYCRASPHDWFNFHDFWRDPEPEDGS